MRCAVRFWSSEFFCIFVFIIFFFALCVLGLSPFTTKPAEQGGQWKDSSEGRHARPPVEAGCGGREVGDAKNLVAQPDSCEVERSPGAEAKRRNASEAKTMARSRSTRARKRSAAAFRLRDKLESGGGMRAAVLRSAAVGSGARSRSESRRSQDAGQSLSPTIRDGATERSGSASRWSGSTAAPQWSGVETA